MTYEEFKEKVGSVILTGEGNCPVTPVVQMLQGKWKLQILYELCIKCPMRFGELKKMLKPITNTALTNALKELEADDLIQRIQYNEMPLRVEYSLTLKGQELICKGWFLPPNTYDCGSFVVNGTAVVGKEKKSPYNRWKSTQKGANFYEISI